MSLISTISRRFFSIIFRDGKYYKVRFGKLRGLKSYYRQGINYNTIIGLYEMDSLKMLDKIILEFGLDRKDIVVADVGSNLGYYSMFFSKKLSSKSKIYAFEPSVSILDVLRKNIEINKLANVEIVEAACSETVGNVEFFIGQNHYTSSMLGTWAGNATTGTLVKVRSTSIDYFFGKEGIGKYPDLIKMDIEGAGVFALKGCDRCLQQKRPLILIESHTPDEDEAIGGLLRNYNYEAFRINNGKWILNNDKNYLDADGVWGTMVLVPSEKKGYFLQRNLHRINGF
jgi:FkbM family methyltransferase